MTEQEKIEMGLADFKREQQNCLISLQNTGVKWMTRHVHYSESRAVMGMEATSPYIILHKIKEKPGHPAYWSHKWTTIEDGSDLRLLLPLLDEIAKPFDISAAVGQILKEKKCDN